MSDTDKIHLGWYVVKTSNFGLSGESPGHDERFLLWPMPQDMAQRICDILREETSDYGRDWYKVERDDYKLRVFEP